MKNEGKEQKMRAGAEMPRESNRELGKDTGPDGENAQDGEGLKTVLSVDVEPEVLIEDTNLCEEERKSGLALKAAQDHIELLKDQLLRALAETENLRKRAHREREEATKYGITNFARDIVGITDNLQRALESVPESSDDSSQGDRKIQSLKEGILLTRQEFKSVLARNGIEQIEPQGEAFDHNYHQAMFEVETSEHAAGTVVQVLQLGYKIHSRLLRPAMVGVAKNVGKSDEE